MSFLYFDTNVFIAGFETDIEIGGPVRDLLSRANDQPGAFVTSELTLAELLAPRKSSSGLSYAERTEIYGTVLVWRSLVDLMPITRDILMRTVRLREGFAQKLPDAIHICTALESNCRFFMSADADAKRIPPELERVLPDRNGVDKVIEALGA